MKNTIVMNGKTLTNEQVAVIASCIDVAAQIFISDGPMDESKLPPDLRGHAQEFETELLCLRTFFRR